MVYDGYCGGFVPVESASFDVSLDPEAVVLLPLSVLEEQRAAAESLERRKEARVARFGLHRFPAGNGQPQLRQREVRGVDVLRMFRNLASSHSRQGQARIGRLSEAFH